MSDRPQSPFLSPEVIPVAALAAGILALATWRFTSGWVPHDLSAYIAAAHVFWSGENPYGDALFASPYFGGYPYIYYPGTLHLIEPLAYLPSSFISGAEALLRGAATAWVAAALQRRLRLPFHWAPMALALLFFQPFTTDLFAGNLALYMLSIVLAIDAIGRTRAPNRAGLLALGALFGALIMLKPLWSLPAVFLTALHRKWAMTAGLALGAAIVGGLGALEPALISDWIEMIGRARAKWPTFDLGTHAPALVPVALLAWAGVGAKLWRDPPEDAWLWGCASLLAWPRLNTYSYLLALPLLAWVLRRHGKLAALAALIPISLPVALAMTLLDESLRPWRLALNYAWCAALVALLAKSLLSSTTAPDSPDSAGV